MKSRGLCPCEPGVQLYAREEDGGLGHDHAYQVAAAAFISQIDRALRGGEGEPHRVAVEEEIKRTCERLGCCQESPLTWEPRHLEEQLSEDRMIEAWLLFKMRTGIRGIETGAAGPFSASAWCAHRNR